MQGGPQVTTGHLTQTSAVIIRQFMAENGGSIVNIIADMFRGFPMMSHTGEAGAEEGDGE